MSKYKATLVSIGLLFAGGITAGYSEFNYHRFVRFLIRSFHEQIRFIGKDFLYFPSPYFVLSFGFFCVLLFNLIRKSKGRTIVLNLLLVIILFFTTTIVASYVDSWIEIAECTACKDGIVSFRPNYKFYFISSLLESLIRPLYPFLNMRRQNM